MNDQFNQASLANLSDAELQSYLAALTARFNSASCEGERAYLRILIDDVKRALTLK